MFKFAQNMYNFFNKSDDKLNKIMSESILLNKLDKLNSMLSNTDTKLEEVNTRLEEDSWGFLYTELVHNNSSLIDWLNSIEKEIKLEINQFLSGNNFSKIINKDIEKKISEVVSNIEKTFTLIDSTQNKVELELSKLSTLDDFAKINNNTGFSYGRKKLYSKEGVVLTQDQVNDCLDNIKSSIIRDKVSIDSFVQVKPIAKSSTVLNFRNKGAVPGIREEFPLVFPKASAQKNKPN